MLSSISLFVVDTLSKGHVKMISGWIVTHCPSSKIWWLADLTSASHLFWNKNMAGNVHKIFKYSGEIITWKQSSHALWRQFRSFGLLDAHLERQMTHFVSWPTLGFLHKKANFWFCLLASDSTSTEEDVDDKLLLRPPPPNWAAAESPASDPELND